MTQDVTNNAHQVPTPAPQGQVEDFDTDGPDADDAVQPPVPSFWDGSFAPRRPYNPGPPQT